MEVSIIFWIGFIVFVLIMLALDLFVFHKKDSVVKIKEAILWSAFWIALALLFNAGIYVFEGKAQAFDFFTAYLLEKSLSVDNLFVFILIFSFFKIKAEHQHRILFWGIIVALFMRAIFIFAGVALITKFAWIIYVFGAVLIYSGIHLLFEKEKDEFNPNKNIVIRIFKKFMPVSDDKNETRFFIRKNNVLYATPLFIALLVVEVSDVIFAVDSIPAVLSVTKDIFIAFTSNIFAILGLRSLYFALNGVLQYFIYLRFALAGILSFIGVKMCVNELSAEIGTQFHISNYVSLAVIVVLLSTSILLSVVLKNKSK